MTSQDLVEQCRSREAMDCELVIVGGGPAVRATTIRLKQLKPDAPVVVLEMGSEPGAHIFAGAPPRQPVTGDDGLFLAESGSRRVPDSLVPRDLHSDVCHVVPLDAELWRLGEAVGFGFVAGDLARLLEVPAPA